MSTANGAATAGGGDKLSSGGPRVAVLGGSGCPRDVVVDLFVRTGPMEQSRTDAAGDGDFYDLRTCVAGADAEMRSGSEESSSSSSSEGLKHHPLLSTACHMGKIWKDALRTGDDTVSTSSWEAEMETLATLHRGRDDESSESWGGASWSDHSDAEDPSAAPAKSTAHAVHPPALQAQSTTAPPQPNPAGGAPVGQSKGAAASTAAPSAPAAEDDAAVRKAVQQYLARHHTSERILPPTIKATIHAQVKAALGRGMSTSQAVEAVSVQLPKDTPKTKAEPLDLKKTVRDFKGGSKSAAGGPAPRGKAGDASALSAAPAKAEKAPTAPSTSTSNEGAGGKAATAADARGKKSELPTRAPSAKAAGATGAVTESTGSITRADGGEAAPQQAAAEGLEGGTRDAAVRPAAVAAAVVVAVGSAGHGRGAAAAGAAPAPAASARAGDQGGEVGKAAGSPAATTSPSPVTAGGVILPGVWVRGTSGRFRGYVGMVCDNTAAPQEYTVRWRRDREGGQVVLEKKVKARSIEVKATQATPDTPHLTPRVGALGDRKGPLQPLSLDGKPPQGATTVAAASPSGSDADAALPVGQIVVGVGTFGGYKGFITDAAGAPRQYSVRWTRDIKGRQVSKDVPAVLRGAFEVPRKVKMEPLKRWRPGGTTSPPLPPPPPSAPAPPPVRAMFTTGATVRAVRGEYKDMIGTVQSIVREAGEDMIVVGFTRHLQCGTTKSVFRDVVTPGDLVLYNAAPRGAQPHVYALPSTPPGSVSFRPRSMGDAKAAGAVSSHRPGSVSPSEEVVAATLEEGIAKLQGPTKGAAAAAAAAPPAPQAAKSGRASPPPRPGLSAGDVATSTAIGGGRQLLLVVKRVDQTVSVVATSQEGDSWASALNLPEKALVRHTEASAWMAAQYSALQRAKAKSLARTWRVPPKEVWGSSAPLGGKAAPKAVEECAAPAATPVEGKEDAASRAPRGKRPRSRSRSRSRSPAVKRLKPSAANEWIAAGTKARKKGNLRAGNEPVEERVLREDNCLSSDDDWWATP